VWIATFYSGGSVGLRISVRIVYGDWYRPWIVEYLFVNSSFLKIFLDNWESIELVLIWCLGMVDKAGGSGADRTDRDDAKLGAIVVVVVVE